MERIKFCHVPVKAWRAQIGAESPFHRPFIVFESLQTCSPFFYLSPFKFLLLVPNSPSLLRVIQLAQLSFRVNPDSVVRSRSIRVGINNIAIYSRRSSTRTCSRCLPLANLSRIYRADEAFIRHSFLAARTAAQRLQTPLNIPGSSPRGGRLRFPAFLEKCARFSFRSNVSMNLANGSSAGAGGESVPWF
jgi:hypothetical protein